LTDSFRARRERGVATRVRALRAWAGLMLRNARCSWRARCRPGGGVGPVGEVADCLRDTSSDARVVEDEA
jgi:hypothetical protein